MMSDDDHDEMIEREERAIYVIMALAGLPVVIGVLVHGGVLDAGATISLACVVLALVGLSYRLRRHPRLPTATVRARGTDTPRPPR